MTPFAGLVGPSYQLVDRYAAVERTINWMLTVNESPDADKYKMAFEPCPSNQPFCTLPVPAPFNQPNRGLIENRGSVFGVNGTSVFQLNQNGTFAALIGSVISDGKPCSLVANGNGQIFIASAGNGYVIPNGAGPNSLINLPPTVGFLGASYATFQDGYILVITPNSNQFQYSGNSVTTPIGDATQWDAANISIQAGQADNLKAIISSREYLRLLGDRRSQVYYDVGPNGIGTTPFQSYNETFIETGIAAAYSLVDLGDSLVWVGRDQRGMRACWRDGAFSPQRISTFAVEQFWQKYAKVDDAVAFPLIWKGHLLYQITFPSAYVANPVSGFPEGNPPGYIGATWVYDATASLLVGKPIWFERSYQSARGFAMQRSEMFHCYAFGQHLVGSSGIDGNPGAIYAYSDTAYTDCGTTSSGAQSQQPLIPRRIAPHIASGRNRIIVNRLRLDVRQGVGLDGGIQGANPNIYMRISRDGGNTFGTELSAPLGPIGATNQLTYFNRLGYSRDWVMDIYGGDPVYYGLINGWLDEFEAAS